ncbi:sigma-70 family RNA polymerase sigma factor [Clostridium pasteurianum]|uniref:RNA polymerase sigma factor, sigma-70 family n=1 Tax=Clostridium pasteurianum BC1 TaxID=86416 RepID=R4K4K1_CLOPA|nr:sigma-70 family RNA polymerase sigma factor [Clostridium pasteurianum]AGK96646.1 RNA polymerase sigma factor, sigma-70 family [Clostridium pasteurianum BC1]
MRNLFNLVKEAQLDNKDSMLAIIEKFNPLIKKYSRKLNYDGANSDLIIALIETIRAIPIFTNDALKKEQYIIGYINTSIRHKYIRLSKKHIEITNKETELDINILLKNTTEESQDLIDNCIFLNALLDKLSQYQHDIINKLFICNISEVDLARQLNISRQSVNRIKNRALNNLRKVALE